MKWPCMTPSVRAESLTRVVPCSTIDPDSARKVASACEAKGSDFVDAPVSGGTIGAQNATYTFPLSRSYSPALFLNLTLNARRRLTFMVGGEEAAVARAKTVLDLMGQNVVHCGGAGTGQVPILISFCTRHSLSGSEVAR